MMILLILALFLEDAAEVEDYFVIAPFQSFEGSVGCEKDHDVSFIVSFLVIGEFEYVVACIGAFAQQFKLSYQQGYASLKRYMGLQFLYDCYEAVHTQSIEDAVWDLQSICMRNGGRLN